MKFTLLVSMLLFVFGLSSCSNMGSIALPPDRLSYNQALSNSNEQQALLNIVRLHYTDPPYFLSVNTIVSQFSFGSDFNVNVANSTPPPSLLGTGNADFNYSESPTITYTVSCHNRRVSACQGARTNPSRARKQAEFLKKTQNI